MIKATIGCVRLSKGAVKKRRKLEALKGTEKGLLGSARLAYFTVLPTGNHC